MKPMRATSAQNGGMDDKNGALKGLYTSGRRSASLTGIHLMRNRIRIRISIKVKS
jgi:hypothetical protein